MSSAHCGSLALPPPPTVTFDTSINFVPLLPPVFLPTDPCAPQLLQKPGEASGQAPELGSSPGSLGRPAASFGVPTLG